MNFMIFIRTMFAMYKTADAIRPSNKPLRVRLEMTEKSVNTWQKLFVTDAARIAEAIAKSHLIS
jgi:sulfur relay (sulfurtransferase) DsrC/TusE family protein